MNQRVKWLLLVTHFFAHLLKIGSYILFSVYFLGPSQHLKVILKCSQLQPNRYRMMQLSKIFYDDAKYTRLFHAKRNRVELIHDFAPGTEAEMISSLKLHPQGWVAVTRNVSADEETEVNVII